MRQLRITQSITARDSGVTEKYLSEVSKQKMVTKEEEAELAKLIRDGDEKALDTLVRANLRFVFSVAKQYQNRGLDLNDLVNEGNLGLIKAAHRFDETRGFKFISYAVWWIRQSILDAISNHSRIVRLPLNKVGVLNKYTKALSELEQVLGRTPTVDEVSKYLNVDDKELATIQAHMFKHTSIDSKAFDDDSVTVADTMQDNSMGDPSDRLLRQSQKTDIERAFKVLSNTEQDVLKYCFGILGYKAITLEEIGEKMKCTKERVRQIKVKAIRKLKTGSRADILRKYM